METDPLQCPIPRSEYPRVLVAHGGGGRLSRELVEKMIYRAFRDPVLREGHDGAQLPSMEGEWAFTSDSFVVHPLHFPGGNIGDLAVNGTVNDLVCCGARPLYLSLSLIIEEGFSMEELWGILCSSADAATVAGVRVVTGDTKVVEKGKGDGIFINTSGVGMVRKGWHIAPDQARAGDVVIINGEIGDHGIAVMAAREGLEPETPVKSDTRPLNLMMEEVFALEPEIHVMRDPTRGGVASALNEICRDARKGITLVEEDLPVSSAVRGFCEILGFDPLYVANEGKILIILPEKEAGRILPVMQAHEAGRDSRIIGKVREDGPGRVTLETTIGTTRIVDMISGEQLPRIC